MAGAINLTRDPRNGRNFEYLSEDPLLSAAMAAEQIIGIQRQGVISTTKHYSLNCNETNRHWLDAVIDPDAHRESDLLAFEIAIERAQPGAVMTAYNKVNGDYAAANAVLLNDVLKAAWGYRGWVMSDWGGTPGWECALAGLDQECGAQIDAVLWGAEAFGDRLRAAYSGACCPRKGCRTWSGGSCARCSLSESTGGNPCPHRICRRTTRLPFRSPARALCCCRTGGCCR
ncbi:glycosyl hydrolase family 3 N terminal domain protein [Mycobacterium kansasii]|uniref:Glycosyl hydrolase family 3 N terminal domain protein n=1 Tax=Mycobacterium kansasii TaxID=1768 RepID=A0A1V3WE91_MYCKA|nr:glycosyl hydrolase family 3 N terminal domain protein [Mycobacterium kansasii]